MAKSITVNKAAHVLVVESEVISSMIRRDLFRRRLRPPADELTLAASVALPIEKEAQTPLDYT